MKGFQSAMRHLSWILLVIMAGFAWAGLGGDDQDDHGEHSEKSESSHGDHHSSRLSDEDIPLKVDAVPKRPKPLLELGEPFLGTGTLAPGFTLPTGAVWQPNLIAFGTLRTALQSNTYQPGIGDASNTEVAARLDLFTNLQLSGSERLVLGMRNLDQSGRFTSYVFDTEIPGQEDGGQEELNAEIGTLFFEGDFGEIFPNLSPRDFRPTDVGFSVGRQPIFFQEGILINDTMDGIGLTWNSLQPNKTSNFRSTFFYAWNNVDRNNLNLDSGNLFALFNAIDFPKSTVEIDVAHSTGQNGFGDLTAVGISAVQRFGKVNTSFRVLASSLDENTNISLVPAEFTGEGVLLFSEISWTPARTHDHAYVTTFWAFDTFNSIASGPANGGPLGRAGINFAGVGLGNYGSPLTAVASNVAGGAFGYQSFSHDTRRQLIVELGGRVGTEDFISDEAGLTIRYQVALARRFAVVIDGSVSYVEGFDDDTFYGGRVELQVQL